MKRYQRIRKNVGFPSKTSKPVTSSDEEESRGNAHLTFNLFKLKGQTSTEKDDVIIEGDRNVIDSNLIQRSSTVRSNNKANTIFSIPEESSQNSGSKMDRKSQPAFPRLLFGNFSDNGTPLEGE